jgi:mannose-1-phosphate guanylyltransferase
MGTAGPLRLAKDLILRDNTSELLFVFNSDVICDYPLEKLVEYHKNHGKEGTIMVTEVEDPSKYGVVVTREDG